jgi:hypothetical protein
MAKAILVEILGDASHFQKTLDKAAGSTRQFGKVAGVVGLAIAGGLAVGLEKSVAAAVDAQDSQRRLAQAFKNTGLSLETYTSQVDAAQTAGRKLGFTDTEVRDSLGSLITATGDVALSMHDLQVAQDLARFTGKDLVDTTKFMTMAMTGSQKATKALGLAVSPVTAAVDALKRSHVDLTTESGRAELAHAKLLDKMATGRAVVDAAAAAARGQGQAYADTAAGGMAQFHAQLDHLEVAMGQGLLPALTKVAEKLSEVVNFFAEHTTVAKIFAIGLGVLAGALLAVAAATAIVELAMSPILVPLAAVALAIGILSFVVYKLVTDFRANWPLLLPIVLGPLGAIIYAVMRWHTQIANAFTAAWNAVKGITSAAVSAVVGVITGAIGAATAAASAVGRGILSGIMEVVNTIDNKVRAAFGAVWSALRGLVGVALGAGAAIGEAIVRGVLNGLTSLASKMAGVVSSAISHLPHISIPGRSPIEHVGAAIGGLIGSGVVRGLQESEAGIFGQLGSTIGQLGQGLAVPGGSLAVSGMGAGGGGITWTGNVIVQGSVTSERDLALKIRDTLVEKGLRNGGGMFAGNG